MLPLWLTPDFLIFALVLGAAAFWDIRDRRIPNSVTMTGLILALAMSLILKDLPITAALAGAGLALVLSFPLFALGGIGAGDAKLFTAVGAFVGPIGVLAVIIYGGLVGGALALADAARRGVIIPLLWNTKNMAVHLLTLGRYGERVTLATPGAQTLPYGVAIAIGGLAAWFLPLPGGAS
jgi:prepilin peptidase CpaA